MRDNLSKRLALTILVDKSQHTGHIKLKGFIETQSRFNETHNEKRQNFIKSST